MNRVAPFLLALLLGALPARAEDPSPLPPYALPDGVPARPAMGEARRRAVADAVRAVTRPSTPDAAKEGWRVLAGIGWDAAPAAVEALRGADWFGRSLLVRGLGAMDDPALEPLLEEAAGDPAWAVRAAAAEGLGLRDGAAGARALIGLLRDASWRVRYAAVEAVRTRAVRGTLAPAAVTQDLLRLAADDDPDVHRRAVLALADLRPPPARDALLRALSGFGAPGSIGPEARHLEVETALRVLRGLADGWGGDAAVRAALRDLGKGCLHPLAGHALREWFRTGGPEAAADREALADLVRVYRQGHREAEIDAPGTARRAMVEIGEPAAAALLEEVTQPPRPQREDMRGGNDRQVLELVLRLRGARAAETLVAVLRNPSVSYRLREDAAELARTVCPRELGTLLREIYPGSRGDFALQGKVLRAIAASGGEDAAGLVARALVAGPGEDPPLPLRRAAAEAVKDHPELRDGAVLRRAVAAERDAEMLVTLLDLLQKDAGARAAEELGPFLSDRRFRVRCAAAQALSAARGPATVEVLLRCLDAEDGGDDPPPVYGADTPLGVAEEAEVRARIASNATAVRTAIVSSIRFAGGPDAAGLLAGLLSHANPDVRGAAADNLVTLADPEAVPALAARLEVEDTPGIRDRLFAALAAAGGPGAEAAFERVLAGADGALRLMALNALEAKSAKARAPAGVLRSVTRPDPVELERETAVGLLGRAGDPARTPLLLELLSKARGGEERRHLLHVLGTTHDPAVLVPLAALLPPGDPATLAQDDLATAITAAEALGDLRLPQAAGPLAGLLGRVLPRALRPGNAPVTAACRQVASVAVAALGRCGGPEALGALVEAALDPGFSRAAEVATRDPRLHRSEDLAWRPALPQELEVLGRTLVAALGRTRDGPLAAALRGALGERVEDGRAYALSEEWLSWLAGYLRSPPQRLPNRPRTAASAVLRLQVLRNAPRASEADVAAARERFWYEFQEVDDFAAAGRTLAAWRALLPLHDPVAAEQEARNQVAWGLLVDAGSLFRGEKEAEAAARVEESLTVGGEEDEVARRASELLVGLGKRLDQAEALALRATRADASDAFAHYALGKARLARGDAAGALAPLRRALQLEEAYRETGSRSWAWYRYLLGRTHARLGDEEAALKRIAEAAALDDRAFDYARVDPDLAGPRSRGTLDAALATARLAFDE